MGCLPWATTSPITSHHAAGKGWKDGRRVCYVISRTENFDRDAELVPTLSRPI